MDLGTPSRSKQIRCGELNEKVPERSRVEDAGVVKSCVARRVSYSGPLLVTHVQFLSLLGKSVQGVIPVFVNASLVLFQI